MPHRTYRHICMEGNREMTSSSEVCERCGQRGDYIGWTYGRVETLVAYTRFTGLKPAGAHRPLADELIGPLMETCEACRGRGIYDINNGEFYRICPLCDGTGFTLTVDVETFETVRLQVLLLYPGAAVGIPDTVENKYDRYEQ